MAEALGTALLVATVVGSGTMAQFLTADVALMLLGNTVATGAVLVVLITTLGPISRAHFNPAVSVVFALRRELPGQEAGLYAVAQLVGGIVGTVVAHLNVRAAGSRGVGQAADRRRAMVLGRGSHLRLGADYSGRHPLPVRGGAGAGGAVYHHGLLVHGLHLLRQSGRRGGAVLDGHLFPASVRWTYRASCWRNWPGRFAAWR